VVQHVAAAPPAAGRRRRRGEPAVADRHHLARAVRRLAGQRRPVLHPDTPAVSWRLARHRGVAAEADEHAAAEFSGDPRGGPVGRPSLHRRPQVKLDAGRHGEQPRGLVDVHRPPPGDHQHPDGRNWTGAWVWACAWRVARRRQLGEVPVIAEAREHPAHRGVDVPVSELRRPEGHGHRIGEQRADRQGDRAGRALRGVAHRDKLRVRPEPGAREVEREQFRFEQFPCRPELPG
jgi:hypothetical protein